MTTLYILRGLPASGKTTAARHMLAARELGTIVRLNRDDLRRMGLDPEYRRPVQHAEEAVTALRDAALGALLRSGRHVIVDDTNLRAEYVRGLMTIACEADADVRFLDFTDVPLDECIRRDARRTGAEHVGEDVIRDMHSRHLAALNGRSLPIPEPPGGTPVVAQPFNPPSGADDCVMADVDGTLALLGERSPHDESRVIDDQPNTVVLDVLQALIESGLDPVFMSSRTDACREDTEEWLRKHVLLPRGKMVELHMRAAGDTRPDHVVKLELFNKHVRDRYNVRVVLDDRNSVVALWRSMGLTCLQVADGDF